MKRSIALILIISFICTIVAGCIQKPQAEEVTKWDGKESFEPSAEPSDTVLALGSRYDTYARNSVLAFTQNQPAAESDFECEEIDGGVKILAYVGNEHVVVIPESIGGKNVIALGETAFANSAVRAVKVPDCIESIGKGAFAGCDNLATLRLPFVGDGAENTHFGYIFGADSYETHAIKLPASLDMVILGDRVTEIAENAFAGCKMISAIVLPVTLESIGDFAFYECRDLVYVSRNTAVKQVGQYAFGYCSALFKAEFLMVEDFGLGAFYECNSLRYLSLPFVGGSATENRFIGYIFGAKSADYNDEFVPASLFSVSVSARQCRDVPDRAFAGCAYISEFIFDMDIESVGVRAFYACRSVVNITLPDAVKSIGDDAFFGCDNLEAAELGSGVESIGIQAFYGCRSLKSIVIPEKVSEIKASTFALCESLESVALNNVKKVGKDAFLMCEKLEAVDCSGIEVLDGNVCLTGVLSEE